MIVQSDYENKLVIPRWLSFAMASKSPELSYPKAEPFLVNEFTKKRLASDYSEFKHSPTPHKAADLLGAAFVVGYESIAKEVAEFVKSSPILQESVHDLAAHILGERKPGISTSIHTKIARSKEFLTQYPSNALGWMERARYYTVIGQIKKAERCVRIALNLAPSDRFIARSGVRFFLHTDQIESAWDCIRKASAMHFDPWIKATEINIAELIKKNVKKLKSFASVEIPPKNIYQFSELIESFGMLELINGNDKRAKKFFKLAWSNPSHNVITHSEWVVREHFPSMTEMAEKNFSESLEATAWQNFHNLRIDDALYAATEWGLEEPYAKNAFNLGSALAFYQKHYDHGIKIAKRGLETTPHDFTLQNNLCFGLLKLNRTPDAEAKFLKINPPTDPISHVVYLATNGLLEFKKGNISQGRQLYLDAIQEANVLKDPRLVANVFLNLAILEIENNTSEAKAFSDEALTISEKLEDASVIMTRQELTHNINTQAREKVSLPFKEFQSPKILPPPQK